MPQTFALIAALFLGSTTLAGNDFDTIVSALNRAFQDPDLHKITMLFATDADLRVDGAVRATGPEEIFKVLRERRPFTERTAPLFRIESTRIVSPGVALVDASATRYGSLIGKRVAPVLLVLKKEGEQWQIKSTRFSSACWTDRLEPTAD